MSTETNKVDPVLDILTAAFGPSVAVEVASTPEVEKPVIYSPSGRDRQTVVKGPDGTSYREVEAPALKLDGTPKKLTQRIEVTGVGFGSEAKREASEAKVVEALAYGAESLADLQAATGMAKLTVTRALARLVEAGRVLCEKAPPSGRRGRPAFLYRSTVEVVNAPRIEEPVLDEHEPVPTPLTSQDPVSGPLGGILVCVEKV